MGDDMNARMPQAALRVVRADDLPMNRAGRAEGVDAPPLAPMAMPKQVLVAGTGLGARLRGALAAARAPGLRRPG